MVTADSDYDTDTIQVEPKKGILDLVANAEMNWRLAISCCENTARV